MMKHPGMNFFSILISFLVSGHAFAAQVAQVIVPHANVYLYPQASSNIIAKLNRGQSITVSNLPTEGFYKTRLANGDMGWVSGNDVLSGAAADSASATRMKRKTPLKRPRNDDVEETAEPDAQASNVDSFRFLVNYGIQSLNYTGLKDNYDSVTLNTGKSFAFEGQFKLTPKLFWAVRIESYSADSGSVQLTSAVAQDVSVSEVPIEVGLVWSPVSTHRFRFGIGAYLGATASSKASIVQTNSSTSNKSEVDYSSAELCGNLATQFSIGLGDTFGIVLEADYRYDKTGTTPSTTTIIGNSGATGGTVNSKNATSVPGFQIDYSGIAVRLGLELRL